MINSSIPDEQHEVHSPVHFEEKYPDDPSTEHVVLETPPNSPPIMASSTSPPPPTRPILRTRSSPQSNLDRAVRYSDLQEDEAATRQLKRMLAIPSIPTDTQHTPPTHSSRRKRRASRSLSDALSSAVINSVVAPSPRPLQRRKAHHHIPSVADVAQHGRLYDHVNHGNRQQWIATCSHILRRYHHASIADDNAEKADAFAELLFLPGRVLAKVSRGGRRSHRRGRRTPTTVIRQRLAQELSGIPHTHSEEEKTERPPPSHPTAHTHTTHPSADSSNERDTDLPANPLLSVPLSLSDSDPITLDPFDGLTSSEDRSAASRANRLVHHGHIRKAAHVLNSTTIKADLSDPDVMEELRSLHPALPEGSLFPSIPTATPHVQFDDDDSEIHRILRQSNNGSSAGPSGWGGNMVSILADDSRCRTALLRLMQDLCNDNIPDSIRDLLLSSHLVAIQKPSGGLRPIAIGELFYRIAGSIAVRRVRAEATSLLAPHQFGFGLRNGCERIVHSLQHALTDKDHPCAALQLDLTNAFNCVDRTRLLTTVYNTPQLAPIWRLVNLAYATESPLLLDRGEGQFMSSSNGIRQGDPLSSLLFCFYIKDVLADVARCHGVQPYACMDDIHLVGEPSSLMAALHQLQQSLPELNLYINTSKSHFAYFHSDTHPLSPHVLDMCDNNRIPIEHHSLHVLGAVVARDEAQLTSALQDTTTSDYSTTPFFRRVASPVLTPQAALLLLRQCGLPKMNYLSRCIPPSCLAPIATAFDDTVVDVAYTKLDVAVNERTPRTLECLRNRLQLGGFGLTSVLASSPAAYIASIAALAVSRPTPPAFTSPDDSAFSLSCDSLLFSWLDSSLTQLKDDFADLHAAAPRSLPSKAIDKLPSTASTFFSHFQSNTQLTVQLQHSLVQQAAQLRFDAAVEVARSVGEVKRVAHLLAYSAAHAHHWKTVIPSCAQHTLSASHYIVSARLNLGLRPYHTLLPHDCASCGTKNAMALDAWHHLSCNGHKRQELTLRHDSVVNALYHHSDHSGAAACKEPQGLSTEDGRRPDLQIILPGACILTDVVVSHPLCPSYVSLASTRPLAIARRAANYKQLKYKDVAATQLAHFIPFAVETTGGLSQDAKKLIDQLSLACKDHLTLPSHHTFANTIHSSVAIAIQRGNALAIQAGYSRAVMRASRG